MWRAEARACGAAELAASSLDGQFESLDNLGNELGLQRRLAALKTGQVLVIAAPQPSPSPADDQSSISG